MKVESAVQTRLIGLAHAKSDLLRNEPGGSVERSDVGEVFPSNAHNRYSHESKFVAAVGISGDAACSGMPGVTVVFNCNFLFGPEQIALSVCGAKGSCCVCRDGYTRVEKGAVQSVAAESGREGQEHCRDRFHGRSGVVDYPRKCSGGNLAIAGTAHLG